MREKIAGPIVELGRDEVEEVTFHVLPRGAKTWVVQSAE